MGFFDNEDLLPAKKTRSCFVCPNLKIRKEPPVLLSPVVVIHSGKFLPQLKVALNEEADFISFPLCGKASPEANQHCFAEVCSLLKANPNLQSVIFYGSESFLGFFGSKVEQGRMDLSDIVYSEGYSVPDRDLGVFIHYIPLCDNLVINDPVRSRLWRENVKQAESVKEKPVFLEYPKVQIIDDPALLYNPSFKDCCSIDFETTGLKPYGDKHCLYSCAVSDGKITYAFLVTPKFHDILAKMLQTYNIIGHNLKFENMWAAEKLGVKIKRFHWDTQIAEHCLDNRSKLSLKYLVWREFGILNYDAKTESFLKTPNKSSCLALNRIKEAPLNDVLVYNGYDAYFTAKLYEKQQTQLKNKFLEGYQFFLDSAIALSECEINGYCYDLESANSVYTILTERMNEIETRIQSSPELKDWPKGEPFDHNSILNLKKLFFEIHKIKAKFTKKGNEKLDAEELEKIPLAIAKDIVLWRKVAKIRDTFLKQFTQETSDGICHSFFSITTVKSFRSSSMSPNFQNCPKRDKEAKVFLRQSIKPSPGHKIVEYDYKAVEVAISACYNLDPVLITYITDPTTDMHKDMACEIFMRTKETVLKEERYDAKNAFVFPAFYGSYYAQMAPDLWARALAREETLQNLKDNGIRTYFMFEKHIQEIERFFWEERFPVYAKWKEDQYKRYLTTGYVDLKTGFRCWGPMRKNEVINYPVQGAAFHVCLWTMTKVNDILRNKRMDSRFIGEIHDAMILDVNPNEEEELDKIVKQAGTIDVRDYWKWIIVPLTIEKEATKVDGNWSQMESGGTL